MLYYWDNKNEDPLNTLTMAAIQLAGYKNQQLVLVGQTPLLGFIIITFSQQVIHVIAYEENRQFVWKVTCRFSSYATFWVAGKSSQFKNSFGNIHSDYLIVRIETYNY